MEKMELFGQISELLQQGRAPKVKAAVQEAVDAGYAAQDILDNALLAGMDIIGAKFKNNEVFVPEVLVAARAMNKGVEILRPLLMEAGAENKGTVILGTVAGDLHDIGKNLVRMMMEGKGLTVVDLGVDIAPEAFIAAAKEHDAKIIACSALLTTTMGVMGDVVKAVNASDIAGKVKIMVGGAPITQTFADSIGADCFTTDAATAAEAALAICVG